MGKEQEFTHQEKVSHFIAHTLKALPQTGFLDMTDTEADAWERDEKLVSHEIDKMLEGEALELRYWQQEVAKLGKTPQR